MLSLVYFFCFFFFNDTATTEIYTLSLHDALPISGVGLVGPRARVQCGRSRRASSRAAKHRDRKSTRLNSSHSQISYAVFCLKKKKKKKDHDHEQENTYDRTERTLASTQHGRQARR